MTDILATKLSAVDFSPELYIKNLTQNALSVDELIINKQKIQSLSDETNGCLKKNVYKNYMQFIETAKEISYLESEMYQLSHMLTEQQGVINALLEISITGVKSSNTGDRQVEKNDEDSNKSLSSLLEKVEGCASILDVRGRHLVYSAELIEASPSDFTIIRKIYAVMLNDSLMLATPLLNRRGPVQYKFQDLYELDSLALVNIQDDNQMKNAFKVLMFPDTKLFICESSQVKKEWIEVFERLKKEKITPTGIRRESFLDAKNPFIEDRVSLRSFGGESADDYRTDVDIDQVPELYLELPEELDVHIAQRDFEGAVELVMKANDPKIALPKEMRARIDHRIKTLVDVLMKELRVSPDKSLQGGPRAARRAVHLLILLEKSSQACSLFLKHRSAILKQSMKQQKVEGATTPYINRLCTVFFNNMSDTGKEFNRAFNNSNNCASAFVIWAQSELLRFLKIFSRHVFTMQVTLSTVAECVEMVLKRCHQLCDIGLDLVFILEEVLWRDVENIIIDAKSKLMEAVKLRASEERWKPQNLQNKAGVTKFLEDMMDIGITNTISYVYDDTYISLSLSTTLFSRSYMTFVDDLLKLYTPTSHNQITLALVECFLSQLRHIEIALSSEKYSAEAKFIQKNAKFLLDVVLPLAERNYEKKVGEASRDLKELHNKLPELLAIQTSTPSPAKSITKYSSSAYL